MNGAMPSSVSAAHRRQRLQNPALKVDTASLKVNRRVAAYKCSRMATRVFH